MSSLVIVCLRSLVPLSNSSKAELCSSLTSGSEKLLCSTCYAECCLPAGGSSLCCAKWQMHGCGTIPSTDLLWVKFKVQLLACCSEFLGDDSFLCPKGNCHVPGQGGCSSSHCAESLLKSSGFSYTLEPMVVTELSCRWTQSHPDMLVSSSADSPGVEQVLSHIDTTLSGYIPTFSPCSWSEPEFCI